MLTADETSSGAGILIDGGMEMAAMKKELQKEIPYSLIQ